MDPNRIIDPVCPRIVHGITSVAALCTVLDIPLPLRPLDCELFLHGYGENCSDAQLTIRVWDLPLIDLSGIYVQILFYVTKVNGMLLVGNEILHQSYPLGPKNLLVIPENVRGLSLMELCFQT